MAFIIILIKTMITWNENSLMSHVTLYWRVSMIVGIVVINCHHFHKGSQVSTVTSLWWKNWENSFVWNFISIAFVITGKKKNCWTAVLVLQMAFCLPGSLSAVAGCETASEMQKIKSANKMIRRDNKQSWSCRSTNFIESWWPFPSCYSKCAI